MKTLKDFINEAKRDVSTFDKSLGKVLFNHADELNKLKTINDIYSFLDKIKPELSDNGKEYVETKLLPDIKKERNFIRAYQYIYNIYMAGFEDSKIGK